jgi:hypothetical protein
MAVQYTWSTPWTLDQLIVPQLIKKKDKTGLVPAYHVQDQYVMVPHT